MVESRSPTYNSKRWIKKQKVPVIHRQTVTMDTVIKPLLKDEKLLTPPDSKVYEIKISQINSHIRKLKEKLKTKIETQETNGISCLTASQLKEDKERRKQIKEELHKQREIIELKDKSLKQEIEKDPHNEILRKSKQKMSVQQANQKKEAINKKINVATLSTGEEAKLIKELENIDQVLPILKKIEERDKIRKEQEKIWNLISTTTKEINDIEAALIAVYDGNTKENVKGETKEIENLKSQIDIFLEEKREIKISFQEEEKAYNDQQSEYLTAKWIAKRKEELIKLRMKESSIKEQELKKCENLICTCKTISAKYAKTFSNQNFDGKVSEKGKKKNNKKKKKAEIIMDALELDTLRDQFAYYGVPLPKGKEDIPITIDFLLQKSNEIKNRQLTSAIYCSENGDESFDATSETLSASTLSFSNLIE